MTTSITGQATELQEPGWFLCYSPGRQTWHYFRAGQLRSICGRAASYQRSVGVIERSEVMSSLARMRAGACQSCERVRLREETTS